MMKLFQKMKPAEKKKFLSMDLAERMMRVEQSVSASFNQYIPYDETNYYKSFTEQEKKEFKKFIKDKKRNKILLGFFLIASVIAVFALNFNSSITGNAISSQLGAEKFSIAQISAFAVFTLLIVITASLLLKKHSRSRLARKHIKVIDNIIINRTNTKAFKQ